MSDTNNRKTLLELLAHAGITRERAAQLIAEETKRPCSWRAVQSWVAEPHLKSARGCPDWAIRALESRLKALGQLPSSIE